MAEDLDRYLRGLEASDQPIRSETKNVQPAIGAVDLLSLCIEDGLAPR